MSLRRYPQFLLLGDSLIEVGTEGFGFGINCEADKPSFQYTSLMKDGFSFGAGLAERESKVSLAAIILFA